MTVIDKLESNNQTFSKKVIDPKDEETKNDSKKINWCQDIKVAFNFVVFNPEGLLIVGPLMLFLESAALKVITKRVPYTEIDYKAYMEQIEMIQIDNVFDYSLIRGGTGPLVYPAGHVFIYKCMYWITNGMNNLYYGQVAFRYLYLGTLLLQLIVYNYLQLPPWCVLLASLSKRLHSIYVLRLFNDCFTTYFIVLTVLIFVTSTRLSLRSPYRYLCVLLGSLTYSFAVSVKMNALLYLPAVFVVVYLLNNGNLLKSFSCVVLILGWQIFIALPFLTTHPSEYLQCAFDFKRQFMFKWSINWQFIGEMGFQDSLFQKSLLVSQIIIITMVIFVNYPRNLLDDIYRSFRHPFTDIVVVNVDIKVADKKESIQNDEENNNGNVFDKYEEQQLKLQQVSVPILLILTNFAGVLFARSLHYQFLSWYHWTIPVLFHWSQLNMIISLILFALNEYCWNSYPPNSHASALFILVNSIIFLSVVYTIFTNKLNNPEKKDYFMSNVKVENNIIEKKNA